MWCRLGDISNYGIVKNCAVSDITNDSWILELEDIEKNSANLLNVIKKSDRKICGVRNKFQKGDILYSKLRTYLNKVLVAPNNGYCTTEIVPFSSFGLVSNKYICYVLRSVYFLRYTEHCVYGMKMPRLNTNDACKALIPLPPINEQSRIVSAIERLFAIVDDIENRANSVFLAISQVKQKILNLAIHGKLVPQDPADEPATELLRRVNPRAKITCDNEHNWKLPENWTWTKGINIFLPMKSTKPKDEEFQYIDIDSIDNKQQIISEIKTVQTSMAPSRASRYTQRGDVVFSMVRPYLRNIAKVTTDNCIASTGFYVCSPIPQLIDSDYCYYLMISDYVVNGLNQFMKGDNSPSINKRHIEEWIFPLPPLSEQRRIVEKIKKLYTTIENIQNALEA